MKVSVVTDILEKYNSFWLIFTDSRKNDLLNFLKKTYAKRNKDEELSNEDLISLIKLIEPTYTNLKGKIVKNEKL